MDIEVDRVEVDLVEQGDILGLHVAVSVPTQDGGFVDYVVFGRDDASDPFEWQRTKQSGGSFSAVNVRTTVEAIEHVEEYYGSVDRSPLDVFKSDTTDVSVV